MFYIKYTIALIAFVVVTLKVSIITRTIQQLVGQLFSLAEYQLGIPAEYMVLAELTDVDGKVTFLVFCLILFNLLRGLTLLTTLGGKLTKPKSVPKT